ncbi:MAG: hypothetical protein J7599_07425 [Niabella sp.]|nr:hypothetical protein [Niabella sp.]
MELTPGQKAKTDLLAHFFEDNPPPKVLQLHPGTTQNNAQAFVAEYLKMLYNGELGELMVRLTLDRLDDIKKVMEEQK